MEYASRFIRTYLGGAERSAATYVPIASIPPELSPGPGRRHILFRPSMVVFSLLVIATILIVTDLALIGVAALTDGTSNIIPKLDKAFSLDKELNIPSYFSTLILLFSSVQLAAIVCLEYKYGLRKEVKFWLLLCGGFFFISFDELVSVHEKLVEPMRAILRGGGSGFFHFGWVAVAVPLVLILGILLFGFWLRLPPEVRWMTLIAAFLYLSGAVGMEMINGRYALSHGEGGAVYKLMTATEETLEMAGSVLFIYSLFRYMLVRYGPISILIGEVKDSGAERGTIESLDEQTSSK